MASTVDVNVDFGLDESKLNPDIVRERKKAEFDPLDLTNVLDRGKDRTALRRRIGKLLRCLLRTKFS